MHQLQDSPVLPYYDYTIVIKQSQPTRIVGLYSLALLMCVVILKIKDEHFTKRW